MFKNVFSKLRNALSKKVSKDNGRNNYRDSREVGEKSAPFSEELNSKDMLESGRPKDDESRDDINNASSNMKCPSCNQSLIASIYSNGNITYLVRDTTSLYNSRIYMVEKDSLLYNELSKLDLDDETHIIKAQEQINVAITNKIGVLRCFLDKRTELEFICPVCKEKKDSRVWINNGSSYGECTLCGSDVESLVTNSSTKYVCLKNKNHKIEVGY